MQIKQPLLISGYPKRKTLSVGFGLSFNQQNIDLKRLYAKWFCRFK
jgi:hypothetical protein